MEQTNKNWLKNCIGVKNSNYTTPAGNGEAIVEHKLDKNGNMTKKWITNQDGTTKVKTHNLYLDIQKARASTDYKKLIKDNDFDLEKVQFVLNSKNPNEQYDMYKDFTNFGDIETYKSMENKIINSFGSFDNFNKFVKNKVDAYKHQYQRQKNAWEKQKMEQAKRNEKKEGEIK